MSRKLRIAGACLNQTPFDWTGNLDNIFKAIQEAQSSKVDILCMPELCISGYGCEDMFLSDWVPDTALNQINKILPLTQNIIITVGLPVKYEGKVYNAIAIIENCELKGFYAKHNLAIEGVHYESRWFESWPYEKVVSIPFLNKMIPFGALSLELNGINTGFEICEDAWWDDRPACRLLSKGVELILNPSASHFAFEKELFREKLVLSSSQNFNCVYLYTNMLGNEAGRMIYDGDILIAQKGNLIGHNKRFSFKPVNLLYVDIDFDSNESNPNVKKDWSTKNEEFSNALPLALFDYMRKSKSNGFVLSLSGGADSSTIAVMVAHMVKIGVNELGVDHFIKALSLPGNPKSKLEIVKIILTTAYQGTKNSSDETRKSAKNLAESIGSNHYEWEIDDQVKLNTSTIENAIGRKLSWEQDDITLQNIQARSRSPIIWMLANIENSLLLTTSNRSEGDVGYATMDGDTSGSISPIAAVEKSFILEWLKYAETELGYKGLKEVNLLQPTAELRPSEKHQTDEDDLMPYKVLVAIERLAIKERKSPVEVYKILRDDINIEKLKLWISKFYTLWSRNQWKRERIAPSFHLDDFNVDPRTWCRFPILSGGYFDELKELDNSSD